jgi:ABC-type multidrug transport system ATPase subunit
VILLTGLTSEQHKKIGQLSKGYRQRVGLANALLHNPDVLILDEPTTGLDPNQLVEIRNVIRSVGRDKTVFLSTHIMQEVEAICDRVIIIDHGKIVTDKKIDRLVAVTQEQIIDVEFDRAIASELIKYFLENKDDVSRDFGKESEIQPVEIFQTDNIFNYAISMNDNGQYFIDPNVIHENLQNMMQINITKIIDEKVEQSVENVTQTFRANLDAALKAAGLTAIVGRMSIYSSLENPSIPGMTLLHIFQILNVIDSMNNLSSQKYFKIILRVNDYTHP